MVFKLLLLLLLLIMLSATSARKSKSLPGCPTSCGNISNIFYPLGIKAGCFRSGFQLTCIDGQNLFLGDTNNNGTIEVIEINYYGSITVKAPIFIMPADANDSYTIHWTPLEGSPYTLSDINTFNVIGCGISAYLTDSKTRKGITCPTSFCHTNYSSAEGMLCSGDGCCSEDLYFVFDDMQSYEIRFERLQRGSVQGRASGKAFVTSGPDYRFRKEDLISSNLINGSSVVPLYLDWSIRDKSSCQEAMRNMSTYACRSINSLCYNSNIGYNCFCNWYDRVHRDGNPYIIGGCPGSSGFAKFTAFCRTKRG